MPVDLLISALASSISVIGVLPSVDHATKSAPPTRSDPQIPVWK